MKSLGQTFGAAGAISGATIGSIASMLYLVFAYMLGEKSVEQRLMQAKDLKMKECLIF